MANTEEDSSGDSEGVFESQDTLGQSAEPQPAEGPVQWRLSTLFLLTTISAIASAGFAKLGWIGGVGTVLSSWLGLIGLICIVYGVTNRSKGWLLAIGIGVLFCLMALGMFLSITLA